MKAWIFKLENFLTITEYMKLKMFFMEQDEFYDGLSNNFELSDNPKIQVYELIENSSKGGYTEITVTKEFYADFVKTEISQLSENYIRDYEEIILDKNMLTQLVQERFINKKLIELKEIEENICNSAFLSTEIIDLVKNQIFKIIELLKVKLKNPFPKIYNKIEVNLSRAEIETIFYLLKKKKVFNNPSDADMGRVIDYCFKYLDGKGNRKDIMDSNKHFAQIESDEKNIQPSLKKLKKRHELKDFLNFKLV